MNASFLTQEHLKRIVCPVCHQPLKLEESLVIRCLGCGKRYPVVDGIPVLLAERAI